MPETRARARARASDTLEHTPPLLDVRPKFFLENPIKLLNYKLIYLIFSLILVYFTYKLMDNLKRYQICHDLMTYFATVISKKKSIMSYI